MSTHTNLKILRANARLIAIVFLLSLHTYMSFRIANQGTRTEYHNAVVSLLKLHIDDNQTESFSLSSSIALHIHQPSNCSIEVYFGADCYEQVYISGTLFRNIMPTCSCSIHYNKREDFVSDMSKAEAVASYQSHSIARVVWCSRSCPNDIISWCKTKTHSDYCRKHIILMVVGDRATTASIDGYSDVAAVYRNYLRHETGNHLSYLTQHLRKLPRTGDTSRIHRVLNWSLAIDVMKEEWKAAGVEFESVSTTPPPDVTSKLNKRIVTRLLLNNEGVTYHTWPDLDAQIINRTKNNVPVFWFPMGYTSTYLFHAVQLSVGRLSKRQKLWSWSGSMKMDERADMIYALGRNDSLTEHIKRLGSIMVTTGFTKGLPFLQYTSQLLDSQFIPLPRGISPEQFRSFEVSDAGAILIINEEWLKINQSMKLAPLAYLNILGYDPVTTTSFLKLPATLLDLSRLPPELLDDWQSIMLSRHRIISHTMSKHLASVVCAANTPLGYIYKSEEELPF